MLLAITTIVVAPKQVLGTNLQSTFDVTLGANTVTFTGAGPVSWDSIHLKGTATWDGHILTITFIEGSTVTNLHSTDWAMSGVHTFTGPITIDFSTTPPTVTVNLIFA